MNHNSNTYTVSVSPYSPTVNKPDSSPKLSRMKPPFLLNKTENAAGAPRSPKPEGKGQCRGDSKPSTLAFGICWILGSNFVTDFVFKLILESKL